MQTGDQLPEKLRRFDISENGCWVWTGSVWPSNGRPRASIGSKWVNAYREVYTVLVGPIGEGLSLDHLCENKVCVNPAHLEPVTLAENTQRFARAHPEIIRGTDGKPNKKITAEIAVEIYRSNVPASACAAKFGVERSLVHRIRAGKRWADVTGAAARKEAA